MSSRQNAALALVALHLLALPTKALEWKSTVVSVATQPFQETIDAVFEFKNNGSRSVTIRDVETNCDCLEAGTGQKVYAPGAAGAVRAKFTIGDRTGPYVRTITVVTDEPGGPVRLSLQVEVPVLAQFTPRSVSWQVNEAAAEKSLDLIPAPGLEINFGEARPTNDAFDARLETVEPGRRYRLHLMPRGTARPASVAIRVFGREKSGHEVVVSAYADVR